jgi:hypothetical protein
VLKFSVRTLSFSVEGSVRLVLNTIRDFRVFNRTLFGSAPYCSQFGFPLTLKHWDVARCTGDRFSMLVLRAAIGISRFLNQLCSFLTESQLLAMSGVRVNCVSGMILKSCLIIVSLVRTIFPSCHSNPVLDFDELATAHSPTRH